MPTYINNQYRQGTGLGDTISQLGNTLFGPGALQADVLREKGRGLRRDNSSFETLQNKARVNPSLDLGDPETAAAVYGLENAKNFLEARRGVVTATQGAFSPAASDAFQGAGGAFGSTAQGFERGQQVELEKNAATNAKALEIARMTQDAQPTNVIVNGKPVLMSRRDAIAGGHTPVLSATDSQGLLRQQGFDTGYAGYNPQQQAAAGIEPKQPSQLYVYQTPDGKQGTTMDGKTDVQGGGPLPQGTKVMKLEGKDTEGLTSDSTINRQILDARVAKDQAVASIDRLSGLLSQPNADQASGYLGTLARTFSDLRSQFEATARLAGSSGLAENINAPEVKQALDQATIGVFGNPAINDRARQLGIDASIIRSQIQDLAYTISKSQDPGGRISVDDVRRASETIGASIMDPRAAVAVLGDLKNRIIQGHDIRENTTRQMYPNLGRQQGAPAAAPGAPAAVEEWGRGPDGRPVRIR